MPYVLNRYEIQNGNVFFPFLIEECTWKYCKKVLVVCQPGVNLKKCFSVSMAKTLIKLESNNDWLAPDWAGKCCCRQIR
jgi:hypothetical protein